MVVDVGCGRGGLARWLARTAALVVGLDVQAAAARAARANGEGRVLAAVAAADRLPLAVASVDAAVVFNSLHHFPEPAAVLRELGRVVRPGGHLYVAEPLPEGSYFAFMQPVDDETDVRLAAQRALACADDAHFVLATSLDYAYEVVVRDMAAEIAGWLAVDPARQAAVEAVGDAWPARFASLGEPLDEGRRFTQPMRVWCFSRA